MNLNEPIDYVRLLIGTIMVENAQLRAELDALKAQLQAKRPKEPKTNG